MTQSTEAVLLLMGGILLVLWEMGDARVAPQSTWWERIWCHSGAIVWAGMIGLYYMAYAA